MLIKSKIFFVNFKFFIISKLKKICIMQPYMFPYLGYFQMAAEVDEFWLLDCVQYIRRGWMNRNFLFDGNESQMFNFSVVKGNQTDLINEKKYTEFFHRDVVRLENMITSMYKKSSERNGVITLVQDLKEFYTQSNSFSYVTYRSLKEIFRVLNISTPLYITSSLHIEKDKRGQERIIEIAKRVGADTYINAEGGKKLYDANVFQSNNLKLGFIEANPTKYLNDLGFDVSEIGGLSILDFLIRCDMKDSIEYLKKYKVIY